MKLLVIFCAVVAMAVADEKYPTTNDNFDIEALAASKPDLEAFTECFIQDTNCNRISSDFKKDLAEAVREACAKCTDAQKHILKRYLEALQKEVPEKFEEFKKKYDPEGTLFEPLKAAIGLRK
uniref:Putative chemosensory protein 16 n=1 Tax=Corcyra cephalonica TaxID=139036 RepID=A0A8K1P7T7_CORCP|nr:putative chemosensory protein 16 [Corcyra cephalonica]